MTLGLKNIAFWEKKKLINCTKRGTRSHERARLCERRQVRRLVGSMILIWMRLVSASAFVRSCERTCQQRKESRVPRGNDRKRRSHTCIDVLKNSKSHNFFIQVLEFRSVFTIGFLATSSSKLDLI